MRDYRSTEHVREPVFWALVIAMALALVLVIGGKVSGVL